MEGYLLRRFCLVAIGCIFGVPFWPASKRNLHMRYAKNRAGCTATFCLCFYFLFLFLLESDVLFQRCLHQMIVKETCASPFLSSTAPVWAKHPFAICNQTSWACQATAVHIKQSVKKQTTSQVTQEPEAFKMCSGLHSCPAYLDLD